ncbi:MAG: LuxR C-terminal-related transcriptional regulator [Actinomycetota bacterium]|nr:LuxR C-terminal-related transcriptional regulator [Actinomycetota bacterium]
MTSVYRALLLAPGRCTSQLGLELGRPAVEVDDAVARLVELGLLRVGDASSATGTRLLSPLNPDLALRPLVQAAEREVVERSQDLATLRHEVALLSEDYRANREQSALSQLERLDGVEAVVARLPELLERVRSEVRSFVTMRPSYASLEQAHRSDISLLDRGVRVRTLCLESVRTDRRFMTHLSAFHDSGAEIRTTATLPVRMLVLDDDVAVIAQDPSDATAGAVVVYGRGLLAAAASLFEGQWERGNDPFGASVASGGPILSPGERGLVKLLAQGLKDETCARNLDVSVRTIRRMVADLTDRVGAGSRFELAVVAVQRGWI